jgi:ABC-type lipoprotein release transport system permease subunit
MVGIDPKREAEISFLGPEAIVEGRYLEPGDDGGIVIGKALADKFETRLGYKLVLMTQDTTKEIASRAFRIVGIFRAEMQGTEKAFAFVTMDAAEQMLTLDGAISEVSVSLPDHAMAEEISDAVRAALPDTYEVNPWRELLPILDAYIAINDGFAIIWYIVVFIAMGFGIVNTTLMAIFERIREFGLLKALGMKPSWIIRDVLTESLLLLLMGIAIGDIIGLLSCWALADGGIDLSAMAAGLEFAGMSRIIYPTIDPKELITANMVVLILGLLVGLYPAAKAARFTPVEALTHM